VRVGSGKGPRLAVLASRIRLEERLILEALERRKIPYDRLDERSLAVTIGAWEPGCTVVLNRSISQTRGLYAARLLEAAGIRVVNSSRTIETCGDKLVTTLALAGAGLPVPRTVAALTPERALEVIDDLGYPVVIKPVVGSWGRLLARINDRDAAEALLEHRRMLGSPQQGIIYIQEYVAKPNRDIRTIVIDGQVVAGMYRCSDHWITNTARGATPLPCEPTAELVDMSLRAARAVGGGVLAVDFLERPDGTLLVNEVNHTMEFHGIMKACDTDIAGSLVDYVLKVAEQ